MAQKFYVVWSGRQTGVFGDWASAQRAVDKYPGARFKSFATRAEAEQAFAHGNLEEKSAITRRSDRRASHTAHRFDVSIYCDGACDPNPGNAGSGIRYPRNGANAGRAVFGFSMRKAALPRPASPTKLAEG